MYLTWYIVSDKEIPTSALQNLYEVLWPMQIHAKMFILNIMLLWITTSVLDAWDFC